MKKFKVLISTVEKGGTIDRQRSLVEKAGADLEAQINALAGAVVVTVSAHDAEHDFQLIAVVQVTEPAQGE